MAVSKRLKQHRRQLIERTTNEYRIRKAEEPREGQHQGDARTPLPNLYSIVSDSDLASLREAAGYLLGLFGGEMGLHNNTPSRYWDSSGLEYASSNSPSEREEGVQDAAAIPEPQPSAHHYYSTRYLDYVSTSSAIRSPRTRS